MASETSPVAVAGLILDLFCGAGGAAKGYKNAGFDVVGVDVNDQPRYPFDFVRSDAIEFLDACDLSQFILVHASPPCQKFSTMTHVKGDRSNHPDLIAAIRDRLVAADVTYVIENVVAAPLIDPVLLCGSHFGLGAVCDDGVYRQLRRHRKFECSFPVLSPSACSHVGEPVGVYGNGGGQQKTVWNGGKNRGYMARAEEARRAMGIDWMTKKELSQAIPPVYTEYLAGFALRPVSAGVVFPTRR